MSVFLLYCATIVVCVALQLTVKLPAIDIHEPLILEFLRDHPMALIITDGLRNHHLWRNLAFPSHGSIIFKLWTHRGLAHHVPTALAHGQPGDHFNVVSVASLGSSFWDTEGMSWTAIACIFVEDLLGVYRSLPCQAKLGRVGWTVRTVI